MTNYNMTDFVDKLNRSDKEIFCSLAIENENGLKLQLDFARELEKQYRDGAKDLTPDLHKADEYANKIKALENKIYGLAGFVIADVNVEPPLESTRWDKLKSKFTTKNVREFFGWYQAGRLATVRTNRVLNFYGLGFLQPLFAIGGFVYLVSLAIDIGIVFYDTLRKRREGEKDLSRWQLFKNALTKGDRLHRMANDFVWGVGNLVAFLLTGGASAIINICIFAFDIVNDTLKVWRQRDKHIELQTKINNHIAEIKELPTLGQIKENPLEQAPALTKDETVVIETLNAFQKPLEEKIHSQSVECLKVLLTTTAICLGMALFLFFPPTSIPALVGAGLALVAGSIVAGFGRRLRNLAKEPFEAVKQSFKNIFKSKAKGPQEKPVFGHMNAHQLGKLPAGVAFGLSMSNVNETPQANFDVPPPAAANTFVAPQAKVAEPIPALQARASKPKPADEVSLAPHTTEIEIVPEVAEHKLSNGHVPTDSTTQMLHSFGSSGLLKDLSITTLTTRTDQTKKEEKFRKLLSSLPSEVASTLALSRVTKELLHTTEKETLPLDPPAPKPAA